MPETLSRTLRKIEQSGLAEDLCDIQRGLEKESLRIDPQGVIAQTPHPDSLGSPLTHPYITTDYSEALLEFVTPVSGSISGLLDFLTGIHQFVYQNIGEEKLWVTSMPCILHGEDSIPIARYGTSNVGRMKHVYRVGLAHRYGKMMQTIAGIHYNFSIGDAFWEKWSEIQSNTDSVQNFRSAKYLALLRNFYRNSWLIHYLFGASPAVCQSFLKGRSHQLQTFDHGTYFLPHATSLRMSDLGYQNDAQAGIKLDVNDLDNYLTALIAATETSHPGYEAIGLKVGDEYRQLNTNLLQIENEYYAPIRPKRVAHSGEKPSHALRARGVEYIEVRSLDLDPFFADGIDGDSIRFLDLFLLDCLLTESPPLFDTEQESIEHNRRTSVLSGRDPTAKIVTRDDHLSVRDAGERLLDRYAAIAETLETHGSETYRSALAAQKAKLEDPECTPSAHVLEIMSTHNLSFFEFAMAKSTEHETYFKSRSVDPETANTMREMAEASRQQQGEIEDRDQISFEDFLQNYFSQ